MVVIRRPIERLFKLIFLSYTYQICYCLNFDGTEVDFIGLTVHLLKIVKFYIYFFMNICRIFVKFL